MAFTALIIPFYNELQRFDFKALKELAENSKDLIDIYLVDDGSNDRLAEIIQSNIVEIQTNNIFLLSTEENLGKANAIRFGINTILGLSKSYKFMGFTDSDFSSPPSEIIRLAKINIEAQFDFVCGVRISTSENLISTTKFRFIQGRLFTFLVKLILGGEFLDSQCGLKFMKISDPTAEIFRNKFLNCWLIDLEILCRHQSLQEVELAEVFLRQWVHKEQSKTGLYDLPRVLSGLFELRIKYGKLNRIKRVSYQ